MLVNGGKWVLKVKLVPRVTKVSQELLAWRALAATLDSGACQDKLVLKVK